MVAKKTNLQLELFLRESLQIPGDVDERQGAVDLGLDAQRPGLLFTEGEKSANVLFDCLGHPHLGGTIKSLTDGKRQPQRPVRGAGAD